MKPTFESIKKLSEKITFGIGLDKKKSEPEIEDKYNNENHPTLQNQANIEQPDVLNDSKQINPDAPPPRKKRTVIRLCHYCHKYFTAHRRDANFCSASHRQMANKKGYYFRYHGNPDEHYLINAINFYIQQFLRRENEEITGSTVTDWYHMVIMAEIFFITEKLPEDNHLVEFYNDHILGFVAYLTRQFKNLNTKNYFFTIPEGTKVIWQQFSDATR
jgi:hypothetical protein